MWGGSPFSFPSNRLSFKNITVSILSLLGFLFHDCNNKEMFCSRFWTSFTTVASAAVPLMKQSSSFTLKAFWCWLLIRKCSADIVGQRQVDLKDAFTKHHWSEFGSVYLWYITVGSITEMSNLSQIRAGNVSTFNTQHAFPLCLTAVLKLKIIFRPERQNKHISCTKCKSHIVSHVSFTLQQFLILKCFCSSQGWTITFKWYV